jgi:hypothetical protein
LLTHFLQESILKDGLLWIQDSDYTVDHLRVMVWAQETFRVFRTGLTEALEKVEEARLCIQGYLSNGPGKRHEYLERMCQNTMEDFDKQYGRLNSLSVKFEQKIEQISRSHDGVRLRLPICSRFRADSIFDRNHPSPMSRTARQLSNRATTSESLRS